MSEFDSVMVSFLHVDFWRILGLGAYEMRYRVGGEIPQMSALLLLQDQWIHSFDDHHAIVEEVDPRVQTMGYWLIE